MKRYCNLLTMLLLAVVGMVYCSCSNDEDDSVVLETQEENQDDSQFQSVLDQAEGIIELKSRIGDWDAAYLTKVGYFCYKQDLNGDVGSDNGLYSTIAYMPADGSDKVASFLQSLIIFPLKC